MNKKSKNIETVYPLSPLQQGILFHSLMEPESEVYFVQLTSTIRGLFQPKLFQKVWQQVVDRHGVLRTLFLWQGQSQPWQVVCRQVSLPWQVLDWRGIEPSQQQLQLQQWLLQERRQGFILEQAPLMRLTLIRLDKHCYQFVWSHHHLLLDGWSAAVVLREVLTLYEAALQGQMLTLPPVRPYQDYILWLQRQDSAAAESYWKQYLQGFRTTTRLQLPKPIFTESVESSFKKYHLQLSVEQTERLQTMARTQHLTINTLVQGAWALLLSRYCLQQDILFGTVVSGRPIALPGVEQMVGMFINTLPVRVQADPNVELGKWLQQLQHQQSEKEAYLVSNLADIQACSELLPGQSLFETLVVFENYPVDQSLLQENESLQIDQVQLYEHTNYPLNLQASLIVQLALELTYDACLFDKQVIASLSVHLQNLLLAIVDSSVEQPIGQLPMLNSSEQQQLLYDFNDTATEFPTELCVHQLFEQQVEKTPDAIAVVFERQQMSYRQLNQRANQLAHYLQSLGVGPDTIVGLCIERSIEMVIGLLGILKAGGAYLPLDPNYPPERLAFMLDDARASLVLSESPVVSVLSSNSVQVLLFDELHPILATLSKQPLNCTTDSDNLAYVIYTSGSTGIPKGVMIEHHNTVNLLIWAIEHFDRHNLQTVLASTSICFDLSAFELFAPLSCGGCVLLVSNMLMLSQKQLSIWPSMINTVPSAAAELLRSGQFPESVRVLNLAGEACSSLLVKQLYQLPMLEQVYNLYGPSENTTYSSWALMERETKCCPIGAPIANTQVYVLDEQRQPVPIGVAGELFIGGAGVARGYLNRPELTAEKFVADPFSNKPNARLYRTGDLCRWQADGNLEFLGRIDHQVKLRGFRIELGEIEATLTLHPAITQAVAMVRGERIDDKQLIAYVVATEDETLSVEALREYLMTKLPGYMVPTLFVELEALPLTVNGKIDRQALPSPAGLELNTIVQYVPPQTPAQELLVQLWSEVLEREQIGIYNNFFELGGHSLLATQLISRVRNVFNVDLPLRVLFEQPTVYSLSAFLEQPSRETNSSPLIKIRSEGSLQPLFCVHALGGTISRYTLLIPHLHPQQPLYALQAIGLDRPQKAHSHIEEMASVYIKALQQIQSKGPYHLAGWSFGGLVAFEMAQQFQAQGDEVSALILLDSAAPDRMYIPKQQEDALLLTDMFEMGIFPAEILEHWEASSTEDPLEQLLRHTIQNDLLPKDFDSAQAKRFLQVARNNLQAARNYVAKPYLGKITLIQAAETPLIVRNESLHAWENLAILGLNNYCIQGNHYSILSMPCIKNLAKQIQNCLAKPTEITDVLNVK